MNASRYLAEFIGTFFLILTIGLALIDPIGAVADAPLVIASVFMVMVYAGKHISGAHYNPAITVAVFLRGRCPVGDVVPYIVAQCLAAAGAAALVLFMKEGETIEPMAISTVPALLAEVLFTFALVYVVLNVATAKATEGNSYYGLAIGFTVYAGAVAVGGISGGAFNPAVTIGLAIMGIFQWSDIWVHLVGEAAGAIAAVAMFRMMVRDKS